MSIAEHHDDVMAPLVAANRHPADASRRAFGETVRQDRGSQLEYVVCVSRTVAASCANAGRCWAPTPTTFSLGTDRRDPNSHP